MKLSKTVIRQHKKGRKHQWQFEVSHWDLLILVFFILTLVGVDTTHFIDGLTIVRALIR